MEVPGDIRLGSAMDFINAIFEHDLADQSKYDPEVVGIVKKHLGTTSIHSRAGVRLAEELVRLAKARAKGADV